MGSPLGFPNPPIYCVWACQRDNYATIIALLHASPGGGGSWKVGKWRGKQIREGKGQTGSGENSTWNFELG